jgi:hypothetical protein
MKFRDSKRYDSLFILNFRRDIYEDEIITLNEELEYIKHEGSRIIS